MIANKTDTFSNLGLSSELISTLEDLGYTKPTPIQSASIPLALTGRDILGCAQTGTGKTASYALPIIDILSSGKSKARMPRGLVITPTRELAEQVSENFNIFAKNFSLSYGLLIGGIPFNEQNKILNKGVDIIISTPGRLLDHVDRGNILLNSIKILVIDEADRMLDMGFIPDVESINLMIPKIRQTLFFSATMSNEIRKIGGKFVINPKIIEVTPPSSTSKFIDQKLIFSKKSDKLKNLFSIIKNLNFESLVIFCNKKSDVKRLSLEKIFNHHKVVILHGDMLQLNRQNSLRSFKEKKSNILIASDVAGRGLDINSISHVINFDVPNNPEDYIHRIGRTGRAGNKGTSITLFSEEDKEMIKNIEKLIGKKIKIHHYNNKKSKVINYDDSIPFSKSDHVPNFLKMQSKLI